MFKNTSKSLTLNTTTFSQKISKNLFKISKAKQIKTPPPSHFQQKAPYAEYLIQHWLVLLF